MIIKRELLVRQILSQLLHWMFVVDLNPASYPGNLHLQYNFTALKDKGTVIATIEDFDGQARNCPEIGADESFGTGACNIPLAIELLSFKAYLKSGNVHLYWINGSENNSDFFTIEKTSDLISYKACQKLFCSRI